MKKQLLLSMLTIACISHAAEKEEAFLLYNDVETSPADLKKYADDYLASLSKVIKSMQHHLDELNSKSNLTYQDLHSLQLQQSGVFHQSHPYAGILRDAMKKAGNSPMTPGEVRWVLPTLSPGYAYVMPYFSDKVLENEKLDKELRDKLKRVNKDVKTMDSLYAKIRARDREIHMKYWKEQETPKSKL